MDDKRKTKSRMVRCPLCEIILKQFRRGSKTYGNISQGFIKRHGDNNNNDDIKVDKSDTNDNNNDSSKNKLNGKRCNYCNKIDAKLKKCTRCKQAFYCSKKCQKKDWKNHKKVCKKIVEPTSSPNDDAEIISFRVQHKSAGATLKDKDILGETKEERKIIRDQRVKEIIETTGQDPKNIPIEFSEMTDEEVFVVHQMYFDSLEGKTGKDRVDRLNKSMEEFFGGNLSHKLKLICNTTYIYIYTFF